MKPKTHEYPSRTPLEKCVLNCDDHCTVVVVIRVRIFLTLVTSSAAGLGSEGRAKILARRVCAGHAVAARGGRGGRARGPLRLC